MINYFLINESINFYEKNNYLRIETPWTITESISNITLPKEATSLKLKHNDNKVLVGSAEQGFLYLYNKGYLPRGKYQSISPCFRSDSYDDTHMKQFIKNELIITNDVSTFALEEIIDNAKTFFSMYTTKDIKIVKKTTNQYDLEIDNLEIGSYGIRECSFLKWVYGTGIAEPRFSRFFFNKNDSMI